MQVIEFRKRVGIQYRQMKQSFLSVLLAVLIAVALVPQAGAMPVGSDAVATSMMDDCMDCDDCEQNTDMMDCENTCGTTCLSASGFALPASRVLFSLSPASRRHASMRRDEATGATAGCDLPPPRV